MKLVFAYERLDGLYAICEVDEHTDIYRTLEATNMVRIINACGLTFDRKKSIDNHAEMLSRRICSYSSVEYFEEQQEPWVRLHLPENNGQVEMPLSLFNNEVVCVERSVTIKNVTEFINCIEHIRLISLVEHIISLLQYDVQKQRDLKKKQSVLSYIEQFRQEVATENLVLLSSNSFPLRDGVGSVYCRILEKIKAIIKQQTESIVSDSTSYEIRRSLALYKSGATFGYYRGIGRTIYPDIPSIFRETNKREEDRWYRDMKTQFQNDLEKKPYLDRLGMLQHYELPTRMLDVTSSPLVALYMTSNTIYTGDNNQTDMGEIVVYYDGVIGDRNPVSDESTISLDSYGSDIAYIHDGKSYDSNIVLVLAALAKLKYENKERMRRVIVTLKYLIDKGWKDEPEKYALVMELINKCVHVNANCYEKRYHFTSDELHSIDVMYSGTLPSIPSFADQICDLLWDTVMPDMSTEKSPYIIKSKEELHDEYLECIPSYRYILSTVRRENVAFKDHINLFDMIKCFHVKMGRTNDRIQAQSGSFIICGLDPDYIKKHMLSSRSFGMVRFFVDNKKEIMRELNSLGINDSTMLPDMTHHAAYLKSRNPF